MKEELVETVALLPCPFCGGEPTIEPKKGIFSASVRCSNENCGVSPEALSRDLAQAKKWWNTRAVLEALPLERSEPTEAMIEAGMDAAPGLLRHDREAVRKVLRAAMQAAAPPKVERSEEDEMHPLTLSEIAEQQFDEAIKASFRLGAQSCREMMARFVEQGGTETERNIACSIRANWCPGWGDDPGRPAEIARNALGDTDERDARHAKFAQRAVDHAMELLETEEAQQAPERSEPTEAMIERGAKQLYKDYEETTDEHVERVFATDACPEHIDLAQEMREWFAAAMQAAAPKVERSEEMRGALVSARKDLVRACGIAINRRLPETAISAPIAQAIAKIDKALANPRSDGDG